MNTQNPFVLTVSREVGSGGHTVGSILAEKLGARYCDKFLLENLENKFSLSPERIETLKAEKKSWLSDFISKISPMPTMEAMGFNSRYSQESMGIVTTDDLFKAEVEILKGFAAMGSCVVAGRSGFFVFRNHSNKMNVFITASRQFRIQRVMTKQNLSEAEAVDVIDRLDQARENDIVLSADGHTEAELADIILSYIGR